MEEAVVGRVGGDGGGGGAVQDARARILSGLTEVGKGGKPKQSVKKKTIGPDKSAAGILTNPGQTNIQLMLKRFERGKASDSNL